MGHNLNPENLHINGLIFCEIQNSIFRVFLGIISKMRFFPKNLLHQFFTYQDPWLHEKFPKNPMSYFRENMFTYWHTDILTWPNHRTPFCLRAGVQKQRNPAILNQEIFLQRILQSGWLRVICTKTQEGKFPKTWGLHRKILKTFFQKYF